MKSFKTSKVLTGSILGFMVMSVSLLLMPVNKQGFLPEILFWAGLLTGITGQILLVFDLRKCLGKEARWGLLTFCANPWARLADGALLLSLLAVVLTLTLCPAAYICYVALAASVFCFCLHCILNGRVYGYVMGYDRSQRKPDRNNQEEKGDGTR